MKPVGPEPEEKIRVSREQPVRIIFLKNRAKNILLILIIVSARRNQDKELVSC